MATGCLCEELQVQDVHVCCVACSVVLRFYMFIVFVSHQLRGVCTEANWYEYGSKLVLRSRQHCSGALPLRASVLCVQGIVIVGDYDGVVSQVHVASGHLVADVDEHDGRRCVPARCSSVLAEGCYICSKKLWYGRASVDCSSVQGGHKQAHGCDERIK
jgi:hypothetical protein